MAFVKNPTKGTPIFVDENVPREVLTAMLSSPALTDEPTPDEKRERAEALAAARVDSDERWRTLRNVAEEAITDSAKLAATIDSQFEDLKPDAYRAWDLVARNAHFQALIGSTETFRTTLAAIRAFYAPPTMPMPMLPSEMVALDVRLSILNTASPVEAKGLIEDAVIRGDTPFLSAAGVGLRSWAGKRNAWKGSEAAKMARDFLDLIERETWTPERFASEHAAERADEFGKRWRYLANLLSSDLRLDPIHRATGALSPLLNPLA